MRPGFKEEIEYFHGFSHGDSAWASAGGGFRSRSRMFGQGELRLVLLRLIADAPRHGYELIKAIEQLTGGAYTPSSGVIYPTLQMLTDEGAIDDREDEKNSRRRYAITAQGQEELLRCGADVRSVMDRLAGLAETKRSSSNVQVHRSLVNLRNAVLTHHYRGELEGEVLVAIIELLDETARRIERM